MKMVIVLLAVTLAANSAPAPQGSDLSFRFDNTNPVFPTDTGPVVCIDEAHNNVHTADGTYWAFAELLRGDGYRVEGFDRKFDQTALADCSILAIVNAWGDENRDNDERAYPHPSAFSRAEINELVRWVRGGGSLLLIVDHAPNPGAAADLGALLGISMLDGAARGTGVSGFDVFQREDGTLKAHPILAGRTEDERVTSVATFGGHAFQTSVDFRPLMVFGPGAMAAVILRFNLPEVPQSEYPTFEITGWLQGATRRLGEGRVVILGEAAMCTAQRGGPNNEFTFGMNHPQAAQNPQFCLNVVRWLSGLLDD